MTASDAAPSETPAVHLDAAGGLPEPLPNVSPALSDVVGPTMGHSGDWVVSGVSPVVEVPFRHDETLDVDGFARIVNHVLSTGVGSVMFPGFASEMLKLSDSERSVLTSELLRQTRGTGTAAIISVPDHATQVAVRRAVDAVEAGADIINLLPPHQLGPSTVAVISHLSTVLAAVAPTPVVLQYAPAQTGTSLTVQAIGDLAERHENLACVKVESAPPGRFIEALTRLPRPLPSLVGYAGLQLPDALRRGAVGVQPGCSFTELYQRFWTLWSCGATLEAGSLHQRMLPFLSYWMQHVELIVAAEKRISMLRGLIDTDVCRAPGWALDDVERGLVDAFLREFEAELPAVS
ncbi:MAG: dihydrodipicolinate synthase family protein [Terracoccus sp.]